MVKYLRSNLKLLTCILWISYQIFETLHPTGASPWTNWTLWCCCSSSPHCIPAWQRVCSVVNINNGSDNNLIIITDLWYSLSCTRSRQPLGGGQVMVRSGQTSSCRTSRLRYSRNWHPNSENWHLDEKIMILRFVTTIWVYLCLTLSMSAAARLLVLSPSWRLQVGQCSTRLLHDLQMMCPAADDHQMWLVTWAGSTLTCGAAGDWQVSGNDQAHRALHHGLQVTGVGAMTRSRLRVVTWDNFT